MSFDGDEFVALQSQLAPMWPAMTVRGNAYELTLIVISSISVDVPDSVRPLLSSYEERYLVTKRSCSGGGRALP